MNTKLTFIHALSPLHAGTGQGIGVIDLPIAREKATKIPYLPGSSLKGVIRDCYTNHLYDRYVKELRDEKEAKDKAEQEAARIFGEAASDQAYSGSVVFSDQRLLLLPVRSLRGTFAWATSHFTLQRFKRDLDGASINASDLLALSVKKDEECLVATESSLVDKENSVFLEDFYLKGCPHPDVDKWASFIGENVFAKDEEWQKTFKSRLCILSDDVFNFLLEHGTEITARIKLKEDTKTVDKGALWYEEALPAESILSGLLVTLTGKANPEEVITTVGDLLTQYPLLQIGGKATVGRGLCSICLPNVEKGAAR